MQALRVRVLVVDDFEPWRRYIRSKLPEGQYDLVGEARDGLEGVQKAEELQPDLILLDIGLPALNGIEAASRIREVSPKAKILFVSEQRSRDIAAAALRSGAHGYVTKSYAGTELLSAIEIVLQGGTSMDKLNVLVSLITDQNDYQQEQAASALVAATAIGAEVQIIYANNDAVHQTQQILDFVQKPDKRPDGIIVEPVGTGMSQVAKAAVSAGIGWVLLNANVDYLSELRRQATVPVFSVLADHEGIGKIQGQQIAAILGDAGCALYIEGPGVGDVARLRTRGMMSSKPSRVSIKTLKGNWTQESGHRAIKSWLALSTSRELHIGMIMAQNDDMAIGARRAFEELDDLKERDEWLALPIAGCDGVPKAGQAWVRQGRLTATIMVPPLVGDAIKLLATSYASNSQPEERTLVAPSPLPALSELKRKRTMATS